VLCPLSYGGGTRKQFGKQSPSPSRKASLAKAGRGNPGLDLAPVVIEIRAIPSVGSARGRDLGGGTCSSPPTATCMGDGIDDPRVTEEIDHQSPPSFG
jgi:hypothetical protein